MPARDRMTELALVASAAFLPLCTIPGREAEAVEAEGIDSSLWDKLLRANVTPEGWVNYTQLRGKDAADLGAYLKIVAEADPAKLGDVNNQRAFWINAYNALCVQAMIDEGVPAEVPHARVFGTNIFTQRKRKVAGTVRSLDDIEHGILRKDLKDPRLHAALVCGARSCPRLRPEAFRGDQLDRQLDEEARSWIVVEKTEKGGRKNYLDRKERVFYVSRIFYWYSEDFGGGDAGVLDFVTKYADDSDREFLAKNKVSVEYLDYDWSTNKQ